MLASMMRHGSMVALLLLVGCRADYDARERGDDTGPDGSVDASDAPTDAEIDTPVPLFCPQGLLEIISMPAACIEKDEHGLADHTDATAACAALGLRLCTGVEWVAACGDGTEVKEMFNDVDGTEPRWEWVSDLIEPDSAYKRGERSCDHVSSFLRVGPTYDYRCCADKRPAP